MIYLRGTKSEFLRRLRRRIHSFRFKNLDFLKMCFSSTVCMDLCVCWCMCERMRVTNQSMCINEVWREWERAMPPPLPFQSIKSEKRSNGGGVKLRFQILLMILCTLFFVWRNLNPTRIVCVLKTLDFETISRCHKHFECLEYLKKSDCIQNPVENFVDGFFSLLLHLEHSVTRIQSAKFPRKKNVEDRNKC